MASKKQDLSARAAALEAEIAELQSKLGECVRIYSFLSRFLIEARAHFRCKNAEKIVNEHIKLLHRYNEAKDATQVRPNFSSMNFHR